MRILPLLVCIAVLLPFAVHAQIQIDISGPQARCAQGKTDPKAPSALKEGEVCSRRQIPCGEKPGEVVSRCKDGRCVGMESCGKPLEGLPKGVNGSGKGSGPGSGSGTPSSGTGGTLLPPITVDSGIEGITHAFDEPQPSGSGSGVGAGQGAGASAESGWASQLLGFLSGLAGLFGPSGSGGSSNGSARNSYAPPAPQGIRYTPVYVRESPPPQLQTSRPSAPQFVVGNTFGSFPREVFPFLNFKFDANFDAPGPTLAELAHENAPAADILRDRLYEPPQTEPTIYIPPLSREVVRPTATVAQPPAQPQRVLPSSPEAPAERPWNTVQLGPQPFRISGPNVTFPEPESMLRLALNTLPPISSIVSVPNLSFDLARSGTAALSAIGEFLSDGLDPLATAESREVADDVNADSPFFFSMSEGTLWGELARASATLWQSFLSLLD